MNAFFFRQMSILTLDEFKQLLLRKRAIFALILYTGMLFLVFWGISRSRVLMMDAVKQMKIPLQPAEKMVIEQSLKQFSIPEPWIQKVPIMGAALPLLVYFILSLCTIPFLIPMVSCDMISLDLFRGTQRFLLFRVSRTAYFWSKTLAHFVLYLLVQSVVLLMLYGFCFFYAREVFSLKFFWDSLHLTLRLIPVIVVFLAFIQLISSQIANPVKSLIVSNVGLLVMVILLALKPQLSLFYHPLWGGLFTYKTVSLMKSVLGFGAWSVFFWGISFGFFWVKKL